MTYGECKKYIQSDYYRNHGKTTNLMLKLWLDTILDGGFRFLFWFRLAAMKGVIGYIPRIHLMFMRFRYGIDIPHGTKIGYGCRLPHCCPIVINSSAIVGNNVDIYQFVSIGSMNCNAAHIGDDVYIGPNACIVENVTIGDGATIGAGSVVVKDVPAGATVAGNPANVVSWKEPGRLVWRKWKVSEN